MKYNKPIVLFDGVCNLCNATVRFILKFEKNPFCYFATLQSDIGQEILKESNADQTQDSVILYEDTKVHYKSDAALRIARHLKYFRLLYCLIFIPKWVRDQVYDLIARNRYRWFGKKDACMLPTPDIEDRFI